MALGIVLVNVLKFIILKVILKPIWWLLMFAFSLIKSPWKIGAFIVLLSFLFGCYASIQERNLSPIVSYVGSYTLDIGTTISTNLKTLETQELSFWGKGRIWLNIFAAIYMFMIMLMAIRWLILFQVGTATSPFFVWGISLALIIIFSSMFGLIITGHLSNPLIGFWDLGQYLLAHQIFVEGLINRTSYGQVQNVSLNVTNLTG